MVKLKKLSKERYKALTYAVNPIVNDFCEILDQYSDANEKLIGILLEDKFDEDFGYVILGRDESHIFRWIAGQHSFKSIASARCALRKTFSEQFLNPSSIYIQEDGIINKKDIFCSKIPDEKLNPKYIKVRDDECRSPAKEMIREIGYSFYDCDGRFFKDFQTSGFEPRLWELYLYAYLHEEQFNIDRRYISPDYFCKKYETELAIEAVTINNFSEENCNIDLENEPLALDEIKKLNEYYENYIPIKFRQSLKKKLNKKYWEKPHVVDKPFILAVHGYYDIGINDYVIGNYLYGRKEYAEQNSFGELKIYSKKIKSHQYNSKFIDSGFFFSENTKNISAVLFSNSATISKFNRMGKLAGFGSSKVKMTRIGLRFNPDPNAIDGLVFSVEIEPNVYEENWAQGLSMFHNPNANCPIDHDFFSHIVHYSLNKEEQVQAYMPNLFWPYASWTYVRLEK